MILDDLDDSKKYEYRYENYYSYIESSSSVVESDITITLDGQKKIQVEDKHIKTSVIGLEETFTMKSYMNNQVSLEMNYKLDQKFYLDYENQNLLKSTTEERVLYGSSYKSEEKFTNVYNESDFPIILSFVPQRDPIFFCQTDDFPANVGKGYINYSKSDSRDNVFYYSYSYNYTILEDVDNYEVKTGIFDVKKIHIRFVLTQQTNYGPEDDISNYTLFINKEDGLVVKSIRDDESVNEDGYNEVWTGDQELTSIEYDSENSWQIPNKSIIIGIFSVIIVSVVVLWFFKGKSGNEGKEVEKTRPEQLNPKT